MATKRETGSIQVDCDFSGGNILLDGIEGDTVRVHQDLRDTQGDWFYWSFRVRGAAGRTLTFQFTQGNVLGVRGPSVSTDAGQSWRWLGADAMQGASFRYTFAPDARSVRFCFAIPYQQTNLDAFLRRHREDPHLQTDLLCRSRRGRPVELLHLGRLDGNCEHRVLLTCRHHCCESLASYSLEGMLEAVLDHTEEGAWFREHVEFLVVPFVDKDGVEDGDQGKNRKPHDHNRDYDGESVHPETRALRALVSQWSADKLRFALDLHCPWIRGEHNEWIYFVGNENLENWARVEQFAAILEQVREGALPYYAANNLPFGSAWNTGDNYQAGMSFNRWSSELPGIRFGSGIEIPYANANGAAVTAETARAFGQDLARALRRFL